MTEAFCVYHPYFTPIHSRLTRLENIRRELEIKGKNQGLKVKNTPEQQ